MLFDRKIKEINIVKAGVLNAVKKSIEADKHVIEDDITDDQMWSKGIDGFGKSLGEYSPYTKKIKSTKGQRIDHITLRDTGEFHKSIKVILTSAGVQITSDPVKEDGTNLINEYGEAILYLTESNLNEFKNDFLKPDLLIYFRNGL